MEEKKFDFAAFFRQAGEQLRLGKPFTGAGRVFTPVLRTIIETSLEEELDEQLKTSGKQTKNRRNGHTQKYIQSSLGDFHLFFSPRDRKATFELQTVAKRKRMSSKDLYSATEVQRCLVHRMRNSMKYLAYKDLKACVKDLKQVYKPNNADMGLHYLGKLKRSGVKNILSSSLII